MKKQKRFCLNRNCDVVVKNHLQKEGIVYETKNTPQRTLKDLGKKHFYRSGDGTVPYESLSFPSIYWKDHLELKTAEIKNTEHRDTISTEVLLNIIVPEICIKKE